MAKIFISHSSGNNLEATAFVSWLKANGWDDYFFDIDRTQGILPGQKWETTLRTAADRCEAVIFLISQEWLDSTWCKDEFRLTRLLGKRKLFGVIVKPVKVPDIPGEFTREWQLCDLTAPGPVQEVVGAWQGVSKTFTFSVDALEKLKIGLKTAGLSANSFEFNPERSPYPGLVPMQEEDAAIFFGRDGHIVRALDELRTLRVTGTRQIFLILAASGAGKSSFLRAGLLPRLRRDDRNFIVISAVRPLGAVFTRAQDGLAAAFQEVTKRYELPIELSEIKSSLCSRKEFETLIDDIRAAALKRIQIGDPQAIAPIVVFSIDQAEELLAEAGGQEAAQALQLLGWLHEMNGKVLALLTIRSDHAEQLQAKISGGFEETHPYQLGAIETAEYSRLIDGPAERLSASGRALIIEPELRSQIIQDIKGLGDILPLLALTLNRLYTDYGSDGKLELREYEAMGEIRAQLTMLPRMHCVTPHFLRQLPRMPTFNEMI